MGSGAVMVSEGLDKRDIEGQETELTHRFLWEAPDVHEPYVPRFWREDL